MIINLKKFLCEECGFFFYSLEKDESKVFYCPECGAKAAFFYSNLEFVR